MLTRDRTPSVVIEVERGVYIDCGRTHIDIRSLGAFRAGYAGQPWRDDFAQPHPRCNRNPNAVQAWARGLVLYATNALRNHDEQARYQAECRRLVHQGERVLYELAESVLAEVAA